MVGELFGGIDYTLLMNLCLVIDVVLRAVFNLFTQLMGLGKKIIFHVSTHI